MKTIPVLNPRLSGQSLVNLNPYDLLYRSDRREERSKHRGKEKSNHQNRTEKPTHKYEKCGESPKGERGKGDTFLLHHLSFELAAIFSSSVWRQGPSDSPIHCTAEGELDQHRLSLRTAKVNFPLSGSHRRQWKPICLMFKLKISTIRFLDNKAQIFHIFTFLKKSILHLMRSVPTASRWKST